MNIDLKHGDCLIESNKIKDGSVDLILTDLPYGTVTNIASSETVKHGMQNKTTWDNVIDTDNIMSIANRILRKNGKMVLFAQQPFTTELISKQVANVPFNYCMIWKKDHFANSLIAKKAPLNYYEDVLVFSKTHDFEGIHPLRPYFKNVLEYIGLKKKTIVEEIGQSADHCFRVDSSQFSLCTEKTYNKIIEVYRIDKMEGFRTFADISTESDGLNSTFNLWEGGKFKSNVLEYKKDYQGLHPTQKPILLLEDLVKTFSYENDLVVDLTMGSGSTGVACRNTKRNFIGIEKDENYYNIAVRRVSEYCG
ncbi:MAG: Modification methylase DpnIIB [Deltaproteobacteria bacterium ADurb.BinA014]|nr:MAG: Modification methylase DpnIIB [Deltaproteobacteria bacterium ADurb.BinA014]